MKKIILAVFFALILSACAQDIPPLNFSVPNVGPSTTKLDAQVKSLTVTIARPDEAKGSIDPNTSGLTEMWKESIQEALDHMAIFKDDSKNNISLSVKILKFDAPSFGASMTTDTTARYEIIDRRDGSIIFTQDIDARGHVPGDYAFLALTRVRESINRSVQNNIAQFLQTLETIDLKKPMFPTPSQGS